MKTILEGIVVIEHAVYNRGTEVNSRFTKDESVEKAWQSK